MTSPAHDMIAKAQRDAAEVIAAFDTLLASIRLPSVSGATPTSDLTEVERAALLVARDDACRDVASELAQRRARLDVLTRESLTHRAHFERAMRGEGPMPDYSIVEWFERADAEVGYLKMTIRELARLEAELKALGVTPAHPITGGPVL